VFIYTTLFCLRKTSVIVETFQLSFVCLCVSFVRESLYFRFSHSLCYPYFVIFLYTWSLIRLKINKIKYIVQKTEEIQLL
jgi:hypothetical protein